MEFWGKVLGVGNAERRLLFEVTVERNTSPVHARDVTIRKEGQKRDEHNRRETNTTEERQTQQKRDKHNRIQWKRKGH